MIDFPFRQKATDPDPDEELTHRIIGACIEVHRLLGPGHLESVYERALCAEFELQGIRFEKQARFEINYKGTVVGYGFVDLLVEGKIILELKSCEALSSNHRAQALAYLAATGLRLALLINFNVSILKDGIKRVIRSA